MTRGSCGDFTRCATPAFLRRPAECSSASSIFPQSEFTSSMLPPHRDSDEQPGSFVRGVSGVEELMDSVRRRTAGQVRYIGEWHSHPPRSSARPSAVDGQQIDWLAALMGMDSMPALMVIAAERESAVIFANQHAEPLPQLRANAA